MRNVLSYALAAVVVFGVSATPSAQATHAWGGYHWARTANPFTLKVVDSVTATWDSYLDTAITDWSVSSILDLAKELGATGGNERRRCKPIAGKVRACNDTYGNNGWLGLAQIWASGSHITQATTKVNDTYFNTSTYDTPAWRRLVMCQEIAHDFGLDHQDENFGNPNLGTCMDYTNDPDGGPGGASSTDPSNEHPNQHDYDMLEQIYAHLDSTTTVGASLPGRGRHLGVEVAEPGEWGKVVRQAASGRSSLYERDFGHGDKVFTFVIWAE